jgi:predicted MFS family arabinose efflux permease
MILMPLGPQLMRLFEISPSQFGWLVSVYTGTASISSLTTSFFVDRFDRKSTLLFFCSGFILSTIACAWANSFWFLLLARAMAGAFGGVIGTLVLSIISDAIEYQRRGTAMGVMMGSFSLASIFGIPFALFLANHFNWHAPFYFLGFLSTAVMLVAARVIPSQSAYIKKPSADFLEPLKTVLGDSNQVYALVFMCLLVLGQFTLIPYISPSFVSNVGLREDQLPLIYFVGGLCTILSSPFIGKLADKFGKHVVFRFMCLFSILPILIVTNLKPIPVYLLLMISGLFFIVLSGRMVPAMAMVSETASPKHRGSFMSFMSSTQQMAQALAAFIASSIVSKGEDGTLQHYATVGYVAVGFSFVALAISKKIQTEKKMS